MSDKQIKLIRKQIRNVVQELLPTVMTGEIYKALQKEMAGSLSTIGEEVQKTLKALDDRSKNVQDFVMRQVTAAQTPLDKPAEEAPKTE